MIRLRHKLLIQLFRGLDQAILIGTLALIIFYRPELTVQGVALETEATFKIWDAFGLPVLAIGWICIFHVCVRYRADRFIGLKTQLLDLLKATTIASFWLLLISQVFTIRSINGLNLIVFWGSATLLGLLSRVVLRKILTAARKSGYNYRYLIIVGANEKGRDLSARIQSKPELGYKLVGFVAESDQEVGEWDPKLRGAGPLLGGIDGFRSLLENERVDEIMVALPVEARFGDIMRVVQDARDLGVVVRIAPAIENGALLKRLHIEEFEGETVLTLFREQMLVQLLLKRLFDVGISATALILLAPLCLVVAALIKLTSPGPIFFAQERVGMNKRRFKLFKFRSMVVDAEAKRQELEHLNERDGPAFKIENDPRVTWIGKIIRKTCIDELPQFFNVLRGEMSLVGPRPPIPEEVEKYEWLFRKRLSIKPGLTCFWQISGREDVSFEQWMRMDQEYIENWSVWLDFKIILRTLPIVFLGRGSS